MKSSRLLATILLLTFALMCFISAPVFSGDDPWDVDSGSGGAGGGDDIIVPPPPGDSLVFGTTSSVDDGFDPGWLFGYAYQLSYDVIKYFFGGNDDTSDKNRVAVEEGSGSVTAQ